MIIELHLDDGRRRVVTDAEGRYAIDDIDPGTPFVLTAVLYGFVTQQYRHRASGDDIPLALDFTMPLVCPSDGGDLYVDVPRPSTFDRMLSASLVAHVRILDEPTKRDVLDDSGCLRRDVQSYVQVLGSVHSVRPSSRPVNSITFAPDEYESIKAGIEYLIFAEGDREMWVIADSRWPVVRGRITKSIPAFKIPRGTPVEEVLQRLRDAYQRNTRYRDYYFVATAHASLDSLRYHTGWVRLGLLARDRDAWRVRGENVGLYQRPFQIVGEPTPVALLPRRGDEIRLPDSQEVIILNFGATGEEQRDIPPFATRVDSELVNQTGVDAKAGVAYRVEDVRIEPGRGGRTVWIRISPGATDAAR